MSDRDTSNEFAGVAIIGMSGRFPGAQDVEQLWRDLREARETIRVISDEELQASEPDFDTLKNDPNYVRARGVLDNIEYFDAKFFGFSPKEASVLDPQQRVWLECAWEALETAGYDGGKYNGSIGVFAGGSFLDSYLLNNICRNRGYIETLVRMRNSENFSAILNNSIGFMPTRTAYKLNLRGPSVNVQTGCSTSLVAVALACQSLANYDSDICLAGGVSILVPQDVGYYYEEGGIPSPDGHCRPFDAAAKGTVPGNGLGVVVLKRLEDALADRDTIYAVIKGWAINNDGSKKVSFMAPSVDGQAEVIAMAQALAGFDPETISYVEAHGTATPLGDPVEVAALTKAFRSKTDARQFCGIGSVKSNVGHLDAAAGVAGLIKTVLALQHKEIPPSLHYEKPNPEIDFANSPFYVVDKLIKWEPKGMPRRAGVSSFGVGGTNAHVVLEEAPAQENSGEQRQWQLIPLSAKTKSALNARSRQLTEHLRGNTGGDFGDVAFTLSVGRQEMNWRRFVVCRGPADAIESLSSSEAEHAFSRETVEVNPEVVFMFPGQGSEHVHMGLELYTSEKVFRQEVDQCLDIVAPYHAENLREILYEGDMGFEAKASRLARQSVAQIAIFVTEYALAKVWMKWGVVPSAFVGHSIGEYTAACLAGVFSLEDALSLVAARGRSMEQMTPGSMVAVFLPEREVEPYLIEGVSVAVVNGPSLCVVSGEPEAVEKLENQLSRQKIDHKRLRVVHAFHSYMTEPVLDSFRSAVQRVALSAPHIPFLSNLTGTWAKGEEVSTPDYWVRHLRHTVRFSDCVKELLREKRVFLEVGPGQTLSTLVKMHLDGHEDPIVLPSMRHPKDPGSDIEFLLKTLGQLWLTGVKPNWGEFYSGQQRYRVPLPSYPFERKRYWIEPESSKLAAIDIPGEEKTAKEGKGAAGKESQQEENAAPSDRKSLPAVQQSLTDIWRDLLGHDEIGVDDNFFELGGHSLIALRLFGRIERAFGKRLPLSTLIKAPTIRDLSQLLTEDGFVPSWASLVTLRSEGSKPPFFCIHSEGGNVLEYVRLAEHMSHDQPFYALQAQGLEGDRIEGHSVEEMAHHYLEEMKARQPQGPYFIGGYCLGGLVAYEMARQLEEKGDQVAFLGLISAYSPDHVHQVLASANFFRRLLYQFIERSALEIANLSVLGNRERIAYVQDRVRQVVLFLRVRFEEKMDSISSRLRMAPFSHSRPYILEKVRETQNTAFHMFRPLPIKSRITLFRVSEQSIALVRDPLLGWGGLSAAGIEDYEIKAFHKNILKEPWVRVLGEKLQACLDEAQSRKGL